MQFVLQVVNPSGDRRVGHVTTAWHPIYEKTEIEPAHLILLDESKNKLPYQIDTVDPEDESRTVLSFWLSKPLEPYSVVRVALQSGQPDNPTAFEPQLEV